MNSLEILGQAQLDAVEGSIQLSRLFGIWVKRVAIRWLETVVRHMPERAMPW